MLYICIVSYTLLEQELSGLGDDLATVHREIYIGPPPGPPSSTRTHSARTVHNSLDNIPDYI